MPRQEHFENSRLLRPVAHRVLAPALWRFTRRSVPRGVALGLLAGILIPLGQVPAAALLALPLRANIPIAALTTFLTNPFTTPPLWVAAYWLGRQLLGLDAALPGNPVAASQDWFGWLLAEAGPATATGLVVIAIVGAVAGHFITALGWRLWIGRKWRARAHA